MKRLFATLTFGLAFLVGGQAWAQGLPRESAPYVRNGQAVSGNALIDNETVNAVVVASPGPGQRLHVTRVWVNCYAAGSPGSYLHLWENGAIILTMSTAVPFSKEINFSDHGTVSGGANTSLDVQSVSPGVNGRGATCAVDGFGYRLTNR